LSGATAAGLICVKSPLENDEQYGFENDVLVGGEDDGGRVADISRCRDRSNAIMSAPDDP